MGFLNLIWFVVFFGWLGALISLVLSGIMAITVIGIPISKSLLQFAKLSAFPFGKEIIRETELKGKDNVAEHKKKWGLIANIIWFPLGLLLALFFLLSAIQIFLLGIVMFIFIITIPIGMIMLPMGIVYVRMAKFVLMPIGAKAVSNKQAIASAVVNEIEERDALKNKK